MEPEVGSEETGKRSGHRNKVSDILRQGSAVQVLQAWSKALHDSPEDFGRSIPAKTSSPTLPRARSNTDPGRMANVDARRLKKQGGSKVVLRVRTGSGTFSSRNIKKNSAPIDAIKLAQSKKIEDVQQLAALIAGKPMNWVSEFIRRGGVTRITEALRAFAYRSANDRPQDMQGALVAALAGVFLIRCDSEELLQLTSLQNCLEEWVIPGLSSVSSCTVATALLCGVLRAPYGRYLLTKAFKDSSFYASLMEAFFEAVPVSPILKNPELVESLLALVSCLISDEGEVSLSSRFTTQNNILEEGLLPILIRLYSYNATWKIEAELITIQQTLVRDYDALTDTYRRKAAPVTGNSVNIIFPNFPGGYAKIPITSDTLVQDVIDQVHQFHMYILPHEAAGPRFRDAAAYGLRAMASSSKYKTHVKQVRRRDSVGGSRPTPPPSPVKQQPPVGRIRAPIEEVFATVLENFKAQTGTAGRSTVIQRNPLFGRPDPVALLKSKYGASSPSGLPAPHKIVMDRKLWSHSREKHQEGVWLPAGDLISDYLVSGSRSSSFFLYKLQPLLLTCEYEGNTCELTMPADATGAELLETCMKYLSLTELKLAVYFRDGNEDQTVDPGTSLTAYPLHRAPNLRLLPPKPELAVIFQREKLLVVLKTDTALVSDVLGELSLRLALGQPKDWGLKQEDRWLEAAVPVSQLGETPVSLSLRMRNVTVFWEEKEAGQGGGKSSSEDSHATSSADHSTQESTTSSLSVVQEEPRRNRVGSNSQLLETQYLGVPLVEILEREQGTVPRLVVDCISHILTNGLKEEGILRTSGSKNSVESLQIRYQTGQRITSSDDVHAVSSLLKAYIQELPQPLLPELTKAALKEIFAAGSEEISGPLKGIIDGLTPPVRDLLATIVLLLSTLATEASVNQMTPANLVAEMTPVLDCVPGLLLYPLQDLGAYFGANAFPSELRRFLPSSSPPNYAPPSRPPHSPSLRTPPSPPLRPPPSPPPHRKMSVESMSAPVNLTKALRQGSGEGPTAPKLPAPALPPERSLRYRNFDLLFSRTVKATLEKLCSEIGISSNGCSLQCLNPGDAARFTLAPQRSLWEQGVLDSASLYIVPKMEEPNVNIYDEGTNTETLHIDYTKKEDKVSAGTLNQLIKYLTSDEEHDTAFMYTFLFTMNSFVSNFAFLNKLRERFQVPSSLEDRAPVIRSRVGVVLKHWIEEFEDAEPSAPLALAEQFIGELISPFQESLGQSLLGQVAKRSEKLSQVPLPFPQPRSAAFKTLLVTETFLRDTRLLAEQMSLQAWTFFRSINKTELWNQAWQKDPSRSPNVLRLIANFNSTSNWAASVLVMEPSLQRRSAILAEIIDLAHELLTMNNFHAVFAIVSALNGAAISRLKHSLARLPKATLAKKAELETLVNPASSYKVYRERLSTAMPPVLPFFGLYLTDLIFIDEGNPDLVDNLINFSKHRLISQQIRALEYYKEQHYSFTAHPQTQALLSAMPEIDENGLYDLSLKIEPRNAELHSLEQ